MVVRSGSGTRAWRSAVAVGVVIIVASSSSVLRTPCARLPAGDLSGRGLALGSCVGLLLTLHIFSEE